MTLEFDNEEDKWNVLYLLANRLDACVGRYNRYERKERDYTTEMQDNKYSAYELTRVIGDIDREVRTEAIRYLRDNGV